MPRPAVACGRPTIKEDAHRYRDRAAPVRHRHDTWSGYVPVVTEVRTGPVDATIDTAQSRPADRQSMIVRRPLARIPVFAAAASLLVLHNLLSQR
jgi:hypothetical protein